MTHCNDLFAAGSPLGTIAMVGGLRSLVLDDLQCRLYREPLAELGRLTQVRGGSGVCVRGVGVGGWVGGGRRRARARARWQRALCWACRQERPCQRVRSCGSKRPAPAAADEPANPCPTLSYVRGVQLTELALTATQRHGVFIFGIDCIPDTWRQLSNLRSLEVRSWAVQPR